MSAEDAAIEAAKQHPIAHPEPRSVYPEQQPPQRPERGLPDQAPPPRERGLSDQAPPPPTAAPQQAPAAQPVESETRVIAPQAPPPPEEEQRPPPPSVEDVWAPGYWYWYGGQYVWVTGEWLPPRPGYAYFGARWVYGADGWLFAPGGWGLGFGGVVVYPDYRHRYLYSYYGYGPYGRSYYRPYYRPYNHPYYRPYDRSYARPYNRGYAPAPRYSHPSSAPRGYDRSPVVPRGGGGTYRGSRTTVHPRR